MIRNLHIQNFLSLRDVSLNLTQRNVLVGPNRSGKSNFALALRFVSRFVNTNLHQAINELGGVPNLVWAGEGKQTFLIGFEFDCNTPGVEGESFNYSIKIQGSATGALSIESEELVVKRNGVKHTLIEMHRGSGVINHIDGSTAFSTPSSSSSALEYSVPGWYGSEIKKMIGSFQFFSFVPSNMKLQTPIRGEAFLNTDGSNFSSWFLLLQGKYPKAYREIVQAVSNCIPGIEEILTIPTQAGTTFVAIKEQGLRQPFPVWRMSDGELVFLAYMSLILAPPELGAPVVIVEEPENYINPKLLEELADASNQRRRALGRDAAQTIITTHSPSLVNKIDLDDLVITRKIEGETTFVRASAVGKQFQKMLRDKEVGLGELWQSGALNAKQAN